MCVLGLIASTEKSNRSACLGSVNLDPCSIHLAWWISGMEDSLQREMVGSVLLGGKAGRLTGDLKMLMLRGGRRLEQGGSGGLP